MATTETVAVEHTPWNKGSLLGQKRPLLPRLVWSIRIRLEMSGTTCNLALFNLAIDSKLRASDLVRLRVEDMSSGGPAKERGVVIQQKTKRPVHLEITEVTRQSLGKYLHVRPPADSNFVFLGRSSNRPHLSTRQYYRMVHKWVSSAGLDDRGYGTHCLRRTKVAQIYRKTGNLRAVQLLLGHSKIETTVRYLGVEVDDALRLAETTEL